VCTCGRDKDDDDDGDDHCHGSDVRDDGSISYGDDKDDGDARGDDHRQGESLYVKGG
jgi:hypothetical protein